MLKDLIVIIIILLAIDAIWLTIIKESYNKQVLDIQKEPMQINIYSAAVTYILIAFGLVYLVKDLPEDKRLMAAFVFGLSGYGIYDFTNGAIFKNWNFKLGVADTIWGAILCTLTIYTYDRIKNKI